LIPPEKFFTQHLVNILLQKWTRLKKSSNSREY
jgi:hypothetical protein